MEEGRSTGNGSSRAAWLLTQAQVAVAVGVIRSRPPGTSGREHAEELGRRMRRQEAAWRETAQVLRQEVLRLRQELLMSRSLVEAERSRQTTGLVPDDGHDLCPSCLGVEHLREALSDDACPNCSVMPRSVRLSRLAALQQPTNWVYRLGGRCAA
ncbi:meiosis-specific protein MEI4-like [Fundulus heteroclitus]|uniref:meiosis-specific protein MEI4-like n=1 Tax=Fundulus heteroclitus TaxID=8078 RepID=UPI00165C2E8E|nr:meiosis-specific protein MEI4-like [Fundulus heteroclitus]